VKWEGRQKRKPWDYEVTVAIPHLNTFDDLVLCIELLRAQSVSPYIMIVDTGSQPDIIRDLEALRGEDVEIHYIQANAYRHSSEPVTVALDLAQSLCRTKLLFHTHSDCFLRRRDLLETWARITNVNTPVVGYRMSPRDWVTREWEWMVGHTALMLYMPSIHRAGATWSYQRVHYGYGYPWMLASGWPDTEVAFNRALRDAGIAPVFMGHDLNGTRQINDDFDHCRSFPGSMIYGPEYHSQCKKWMEEAMSDGKDRLLSWKQQKQGLTT